MEDLSYTLKIATVDMNIFKTRLKQHLIFDLNNKQDKITNC